MLGGMIYNGSGGVHTFKIFMLPSVLYVHLGVQKGVVGEEGNSEGCREGLCAWMS